VGLRLGCPISRALCEKACPEPAEGWGFPARVERTPSSAAFDLSPRSRRPLQFRGRAAASAPRKALKSRNTASAAKASQTALSSRAEQSKSLPRAKPRGPLPRRSRLSRLTEFSQYRQQDPRPPSPGGKSGQGEIGRGYRGGLHSSAPDLSLPNMSHPQPLSFLQGINWGINWD
jgi:hypothetical protein